MTYALPIAGTRAAAEYIAQRQKYPATAASALLWCGRTPSHGFLCQDAAGPATLAGSFGGVNLPEETNAPTYQVATQYSNHYGITFTGASQAFKAANATIFDGDGATSFAHLFHVKFGAITAAQRVISGKNDGSGFHSLNHQVDGDLEFSIKDGTTTKTVALTGQSVTGMETWIWAAVDRAADLIRLATRYASGTLDITGIGSTTNVGPFRVNQPLNVSMTLLAFYRFEGANAEGDPAETMRRIQRYGG
jgi:hypothetical protein